MNILVKEFFVRHRETSRLPIEICVYLTSSNGLGIEYEDYVLYTVIGLGITNLNIIGTI